MASRVKMVALVVFLLVAAGFLPVDLRAQSQAPSTGIPGLSEIWARRGCAPDSDVCPYIETDKPLAARAKAFQATAPSLVIDPYNFQIEQKSDRVILTYEKDDIVRTVWLEGYGHPRPGVYDFFIQGYSTGRYEGKQLVVETTKFTFDPTGLDDMRNLPSSTQKRVVERYWREGDRLKAEVVTEDPARSSISTGRGLRA